VLYVVFVACSAAIAFGLTELLAYAGLRGLIADSMHSGPAALIVVLVSTLVCLHFQAARATIESVILCSSLASLAMVDLRSGYVPNLALLPLIALAIFHLAGGSELFTGIFGALLVGGIALALHVLGNGVSFGLGDVKLLALLGGILGPERSLMLLGYAFIIGAGIGLTLLVLGRVARRDALPFVPMLGLAFLWQAAAHAL